MSIRRFRGVLSFLAGLAVWVVPAFGAPGVPAATEWKGMDAAIREPMDLVVEDPGMWRRLWHRAFGKDAPEIDFDRHFVACVFLGDRADWYYSISFGNPVVEGGEYVVGYGLAMLRLELAPKASSLVDIGIPGQYAMKVFRKKEGLKPVLRMVFKEGEIPKDGGIR